MAPQRPAWVAKDLSAILGLDTDSIEQLVLPDLEGYTNETRLKSHLQDFLGPSTLAKAFITQYTTHRFPRLPSQTPTAPSGPAKPLFSQPATFPGTSNTTAKTPTAQADDAKARVKEDTRIQDALESAFGPGGKVYQKNRDADGFGSASSTSNGGASRGAGGGGGGPVFGGFHPDRTGGTSAGPASASGSGTHTPTSHKHAHTHPQPLRRAGAVTITESKSQKGKQRAQQAGQERDKEDKIWDYPKSRATIKLEALLGDLRRVQEGGKVVRAPEAEDCFCQARLHPLSTQTPLCPSCGLTLCTLQPPTSPCPSCLSPLLSPAALARLIMRVEDDIAAQFAREQEAREAVQRRRQMAVQAEAAFPSLGGAGGAGGGGGGSMSHLLGKKEEARKVLTIGAAGSGKGGKGAGKGKGRVTLTTTTSIPSPSAIEVDTDPLEDEADPYLKTTIPRPRSPPLERARVEKEFAKHLKWRADEDRPWGDMKAAKKGEVWVYKELPIAIMPEEGAGRRKKKAGGQGVGGRNVPGAKGVVA